MRDNTNDELAYALAVAKWRHRCGDSVATYDPPRRHLSTVDASGNVILRNARGTLAWVRAPRIRTPRSHGLAADSVTAPKATRGQF